MKEFGVEKSWTQLLNVSYEHIKIEDPYMQQWDFQSSYLIQTPLWKAEDPLLDPSQISFPKLKQL